MKRHAPQRFSSIETPRNILLIKPSSIGDVVHTLPVWKLLHTAYPQAQITWLIAPACQGMVQGLPGLKTLLFERKRWGQAWKSLAAARELLTFQSDLRRQQFDLVLDVQGLFRSGWFTHCTKAPTRVGFANAREMAWMFYTHRVPIQTMEQHAVQRYLKLLEAIGCPTGPIEFDFPVTPADEQAVQTLLGDVGPFAVLCPGANWLTKRWPIEHFAQLVTPVRERFGLATLIVGGPGDFPLGQQIPNASNLCGKTTLMQLVALMRRASLVITNDSGPMHIAAALNRPLVSLFGPTNPIRTGPFGHADSVLRSDLPCAPCYGRSCPRNLQCLREIAPAAVIGLVEKQLLGR